MPNRTESSDIVMYFQVSPPTKAIKKRDKENGEEHVATLSLAPFTATPKLSFEDVPVGTTAQRKICIINPTSCDVELMVIKLPPEERQLTFSWMNNEIGSGCNAFLVISWTPLAPGSWREIVYLADGGRVRREICVALRSIQAKTAKQQPIRVQLSRKPMLVQRRVKKTPQIKVTSPQVNESTPQESKRSLRVIQNDPHFMIDTSCRRDTYLVANAESVFITRQLPAKNLCKIAEEIYEDSLEDEAAKDANPCTPLITDRTHVIRHTPLMHLKQDSIAYTPLMAAQGTPCRSHPFRCSTERKLIKSELSAESATLDNISAETYTISSHNEEATLQMSSSRETYIVNTSGGKDTSTNLSALQCSPLLQMNKPSFSALDISPINVSPLKGSSKRFKFALGQITEESTIHTSPMKRLSLGKSNVCNSVSKISPIKRLSSGYSKKPQFLKPLAMPRSKSISPKKLILALKQQDVSYNEVCNPYVLASTSGIDPFQSQTQYYDPQWVTDQIRCFKNWLNVLLLPPASLNCQDNAKIDLGRLWQDCHNKEISKAPSKEVASNKHNTNHLLQSLRRSARALYLRPAMTIVLSKCSGLVKNDKFAIRQDKNVHQDIGLQKELLGLLLCYNPLWLRIGLETVYNVQINLRSNSDVCRLTRFLMDHFFNEPGLLKKFKGRFSPKYVVEIKRHVTIKFLSLLYFLDQAKQERLVQYDPCLFSRHAEVKDSNDLLLRFVSALFSSIRDVVKPLKYIGFVVTHKQAHIQEYEYGIDDLGTDLKDGVRLVRIMEIILLQRKLVDQVRVPAISRLQKIHNVKLAFDALRNADFRIDHNIEPKDIVNGHKEKTLSFLWQIIYKFQSPRIAKAVLTIQRWLRSPQIRAKLQRLAAQRNRKREAGLKIARWYKACKNRRLAERIQAVIPIIRRIIEEKRQQRAALVIQKSYRMYTCRKSYLQLYHSTLVIQRALRHCCEMRKCRLKYLDMLEASRTLQRQWRAQLAMRRCREDFLRVKNATGCLQKWVRATAAMRIQREEYIALQSAAIVIQRHYRAKVVAKVARERFCEIKNAVRVIESRYIAQQQMRIHRRLYMKMLSAVILLQSKLKATLQMRRQRESYLCLRNAAILIQSIYRAQIESRRECESLSHLTMCTSMLQRRLQESILLKKQGNKKKNENTVHSAVIRQMWYKCTLLAIFKEQLDVQERIKYCIFIQRRCRARILMRKHRNEFLLTKKNAVNVQRRFRAQIAMRAQRALYLRLQMAALAIQRWWKAHRYQDRERYLQLKQATITLQQMWRANKATRAASKARCIKLKSIFLLQVYCRGFLARRKFAQLNTTELIEQRRMERIRKRAAEKIQAFWRGYRTRLQDSDAIARIRQRLEVATEKAEPTLTILTRTKRNEELLMNSKMSGIINCLEELQVTTRVCRKSCISISKFSRVIFMIITSSNRSLSHLNACAAGTSVLLNVAKCEATASIVCECFDGDSFLKIMSHHCDKEHVAILNLATLLWVLGHMDACQEKLFTTPNFQSRMLKIMQMCERQQKMIAKVNRGKISSLFATFSNLPLPSLKADWGLNYEHAPRTFTNAIHGLRSLCDLFNICIH